MMAAHDQKIGKTSIKKKNNGKLKKNDYLRINLLFAKWKNWLFYLAIGYFVIFLSWWSIRTKVSGLLSLLSKHRYPEIEGVNNDRRLWFWRLPVILTLTLLRGLIFSTDGIVSSWLKSPFGQITYSINKSAIETSKSDEIVTLLTEINEHFKETFKKFGVFTISADLVIFFRDILSHNYTIKSFSNENANKKDWWDASGGTQNSPRTGDPQSENSFLLAGSWWGFIIDNFSKVLKKLDVNSAEGFMTVSLIIPILLATWRMRAAEKLIESLEVEDD